MAGATQATSSSVVFTGSSSQSMQISIRRRSVSLPFLRSRCYQRCLVRPRHQVIHQPWISVVSQQVAVDSKSNSSVAVSEQEIKAEEESLQEFTRTTNNEATISAVMADVTNLIKLIDTRDIVELELKHYDYELSIKKKEALSPPVVAASSLPPQAGQASCSTYAPPPPVAPPAAAASASPVPANVPVAAPASLPAAKLPCVLSPMAGTFYKSPAPAEPPFVKVGDKVTKGQVICIVEAMKLMNEIEADQSGTIVEVVVEDGKPVSIDTPLFLIMP